MLRGLSQAELAAASAVSRRWISAVENAERPGAELSKAMAVLDALGLQLEFGPIAPEDPTDTDLLAALDAETRS
jgi:transcriptional regulator with XRE-family HTH domain